jgi:hypothetical protein
MLAMRLYAPQRYSSAYVEGILFVFDDVGVCPSL